MFISEEIFNSWSWEKLAFLNELHGKCPICSIRYKTMRKLFFSPAKQRFKQRRYEEQLIRVVIWLSTMQRLIK